MAGGGRGAGLAGSLHEVTSLPATQPRVGISFTLRKKLEEEDGKEHNEGRKTQENPQTNSKFHDTLPTPACFQTACSAGTQLPSFAWLDHVGTKWKITSLTIIMPAFLCHRV